MSIISIFWILVRWFLEPIAQIFFTASVKAIIIWNYKAISVSFMDILCKQQRYYENITKGDTIIFSHNCQ